VRLLNYIFAIAFQPTKSGHLFPQIKQRSPLTYPQNPIAYFSPKQRSHLTTQNPITYFPKIKQRSPLHHPQRLIAYFLKLNSDRTLNTHKTRSPISPNQTAIALSTPTNPIAYLPNQTAIAPHHPQTRLPISPPQTAIAPHHPTPIAYLSIKQRSYIFLRFVLKLSGHI
jgi:hypothetical protein